MNKVRYREPDSLYLNIYGIDHTLLTDLLKEHGVEHGGAIMTFSGGAQFFVEIFDWIKQSPVQVTAICTVLTALINRHPKASLTYTVEGKTVSLNNISAKSAVELARELRAADVRSIHVDLVQASQQQER